MCSKVEHLKRQLIQLMKHWKLFTKVLVQVLLLFLALNFFGLPSLRRYYDNEVVVIKSLDNSSGLPTPAVSVCPNNGFPRNGSNLGLYSSRIETVCKGKEGKEISKCVENASYGLASAIEKLLVPGKISVGKKELPKLFVSHFTHTPTGMCFTLNKTYNFSRIPDRGSLLMIHFKTNSIYTVFLHDPSLFLVTFNPKMPLTRLVIDQPGTISRRVDIIQHHKLDRPSNRCNPSPSYSLTACVKTFLSREIGCRLPWDTWTHAGRPLCLTLDQFR